jgi:hypothetical protein
LVKRYLQPAAGVKAYDVAGCEIDLAALRGRRIKEAMPVTGGMLAILDNGLNTRGLQVFFCSAEDYHRCKKEVRDGQQ